MRSLYLASFENGPGTGWVARHGLTSDQYQAAFDTFTHQGFRLACVSGHDAGQGARYAAIWDKRPTGPWVARHGLSNGEYQAAFNDLTSKGYRLRMVNGANIGGQDRYAAIWEQVGGPAWAARHGLDGGQYQAAFNDLIGKGYRLTWVSTYTVGGQARYAALWEQTGGPEWVARHGLEEAAFRATTADLAAKGFDITCGNACSIGGKDFYAALWEKKPVASVAHHGMTAATYQLKFDTLTAQGYRPTFVAGYAGDDPVDVQLRFTMQQQQQGNWCWAATATSVSHFYDAGSTWTQCSVANAQIGRNDCCGTGATGPCNIYGFLDDALTRVGHFDHITGSTTAFGGVEGEVLAGRPLGIRVAWSGGGAHFIAATGTEDDSMVWVSDCGSGTTALVDYNTLTTSYAGSGTWTHSYFTKF